MGADFGQLAVLQHQRAPRMLQNGRNIRGHKVLAVTESEHQRRRGFGRDQLVRLGLGYYDDRKRSPQRGDRRTHCRRQRFFFLEPLLDQMGNQLGIGFGFELVAVLEKHLAQSDVVFDDAVMYHCDWSGLVWMRVGFRRAAVCRPSCMADTDMPGNRRFFQHPAEIIELAYRAANLEPAIAGQRRDSGGVVTAVFKPPQTPNQYRRGFALADVSDYSAHRLRLLGKNETLRTLTLTLSRN